MFFRLLLSIFNLYLLFRRLKLLMMDDLTRDIDQVVDLLNILKSRYFFLRTKYEIGKVY